MRFIKERIAHILFFVLIFALFYLENLNNLQAAQNVVIILDAGHGGKDRGGYDGKGFKLDGHRIPEDAYTYDVAKRIEILAKNKQWEIYFTVKEKEPFEDVILEKKICIGPYEILAPKRNVTYGEPYDHIVVFPGKKGLEKRLAVIRKIQHKHPHAHLFLISLHFDYGSFVSSGPQLFTAKTVTRHAFLKTLAKEFEGNNLHRIVRSKKQTMINTSSLFLMRKAAVTPRVLIEFGNFNSERDRKLMLDPTGRELYARIIIAAIEKFFNREF